MSPEETGGGTAVAEAPPQTATRTILLVDGVRLFLKLEQTLLQRSEYRLLSAASGQEALEIAESEDVDLVVMDYVLPDMPGHAVVEALRRDPRHEKTPILIVTARGMRDHVDRAMRAGCTSFLFKPVRANELQGRVRELLDVPARRHVRTLVRLQVQSESTGRFVFGTTVNLSESGLLLETPMDLALGDELDLRFFLPGDDDPMTLRSRVVREGEASEAQAKAFGILFQGLADAEKARLRRFVEDTDAA